MSSETPYLESLDPEQLAQVARYMVEGGEKKEYNEQAITAFTQAAVYASLALLGELHKLRLVIEQTQGSHS